MKRETHDEWLTRLRWPRLRCSKTRPESWGRRVVFAAVVGLTAVA
jgi:hypothetical protein